MRQNFFQTLIDELEQRLEACHTKGLEEGDIAVKASQMTSNQPKGKSPRKGKTPAKSAKTPGKGKNPAKSAKTPGKGKSPQEGQNSC